MFSFFFCYYGDEFYIEITSVSRRVPIDKNKNKITFIQRIDLLLILDKKLRQIIKLFTNMS